MIKAPQLAEKPGIEHGYFTRMGGVSDGIYGSLNIGLGSKDDRARVLENRRRIAQALTVDPARLVSPYQHHSADVITVDEPWAPGKGPKADALVTNRPGLAIAISTADCGPVLFADHHARVVGAAHAGWRGALTGVLEATIAAMEKLGAKRERISAVLGPTISSAAYEVGPEFVERFRREAPGSERYFTASERDGHAMFDLPGFIGGRLENAGVGEAVNLGLCTYADEERFYSYRRATHRGEDDYGRLMSAIVLSEA
ncbi:peptidoglycan editing factor PgeF [Rhizobiales bacterium]|uniref:peptidoglycan editing factor PgeF n=1 Tax=Hongsoonwoonella zoysiae TaxID=2821844 RepID=UPI00156176D9|nr:peptidoglycan editing factor PgeF [Hongsoonwoonella zoysiae]NRG17644.1 peptidoglycan editing factor PgeF [Hongsoonwoonella zoysiae]